MIRAKPALHVGIIVALISGAVPALFLAPSAAQEVPGCRTAWSDMVARNALADARTLIQADCPVMYRKGWLVNLRRLSSPAIPACARAWYGLENKRSLAAVRFLVTHNCPVIRRYGWRRPNFSSLDTPSGHTGVDTSVSALAIPMQKEDGTYKVPVLINNALTLDFVVDSGADDVQIPPDVFGTLARTGTIKKSDLIGTETAVFANGSTMPSVRFRIRSLNVGGKVLKNVVASLTTEKGMLLLGQSFLGRFKSWSIDNSKHVLLLGSRSPDNSERPQSTAAFAVTKTIKADVSLGYMNLRAGPGLDHRVLAHVPAGATGVIIRGPCVPANDGISRYTYCYVEWNGYYGWISTSGLM